MGHWRDFNGNPLKIPIEQWIEQQISMIKVPSRLLIGTDSQVFSNNVKFATVIVVHWLGIGGRLIVRTERVKRLMPMRERLMEEVWRSVEVWYRIQPIAQQTNVPVEIHVDINPAPEAASNAVFKEAIGYLKGLGVKYRTKPNAIASTSCANWFVQG